MPLRVYSPLEVRWNRTLRLFGRLALRSPRGPVDHDYADDAWSFYVAAWHVFDALVYTVALGTQGAAVDRARLTQEKGRIKAVVMEHRPLNVCHDIATNVKHIVVSRPRADRARRSGVEGVGATVVDETGATIEELDLAASVVESWKAVIREVLAAAGLVTTLSSLRGL